jgi:AcrR family transcriptional regulator
VGKALATRRLTAEARRTQLLTLAREVFAEDGFHGAAMEKIASRAGVTKPVLYQHFESKKELYLALLEHDIGVLLASVRDGIERATSNHERIRRGVEAYFGFIDKNAGSFRLLFREALGADPDFREVTDRFRDEMATRIGAIIAAETGLPVDESELLARGVMGMSESAAQWWIDRRTVPRQRVVRDVVELAWRGLAGLPRRLGDR